MVNTFFSDLVILFVVSIHTENSGEKAFRFCVSIVNVYMGE